MHILMCREEFQEVRIRDHDDLIQTLTDEERSRKFGNALLEYEHKKTAEEAQAKSTSRQAGFLVDPHTAQRPSRVLGAHARPP